MWVVFLKSCFTILWYSFGRMLVRRKHAMLSTRSLLARNRFFREPWYYIFTVNHRNDVCSLIHNPGMWPQKCSSVLSSDGEVKCPCLPIVLSVHTLNMASLKGFRGDGSAFLMWTYHHVGDGQWERAKHHRLTMALGHLLWLNDRKWVFFCQCTTSFCTISRLMLFRIFCLGRSPANSNS